MKKTLAVITSAALFFTMSVQAFAVSFSDVTKEDYPWAIDAIEKMADDGIIKGYEDGTFNPAKTISNLEALVLVSRILGVGDRANARVVEEAWKMYGDEVQKYNLPYGNNEVAYLVSRGVISADDLAEYIGETRLNEGLKRYEVASLITKALYAEKSLSSDIEDKLTYDDSDDIPDDFKKYVAYVTEIGIMNGMGENKFAPNETVTRAQVSVVLYKVCQLAKYEFKTGVVVNVNPSSKQINVVLSNDELVSYSITSDVIALYNGKTVDIDSIIVGHDAVITQKEGKLYSIDFFAPLVNDEINAVFTSYESTESGTSISVKAIAEDGITISSETTSYELGEECNITYNGIITPLSTIKAESQVVITIKDSVVTDISFSDKESTFSGKVLSNVSEPTYKITIETSEGVSCAYLFDPKVSLKRNGKSAVISDILPGDKVNVTTNYGVIKSLSATSQKSTATGIIKEVVISKYPRITITSGNEDKTYFVDEKAKIVLNGIESTFYDLRVGFNINLNLDSETVVAIENFVVNEEIITKAGVVTLVNTNFGFIQIEYNEPDAEGVKQENVFVKDAASIIDYKTQKSQPLSSIVPGMKISATGKTNSGIFEADSVIIIG